MLVFLLIGLATARELVRVIEISNSGARTPLKYQPWDSNWTLPPNELTTVGMRQQYLLGHELRRRLVTASSFLFPTFDTNEIKVYSINSPVDFESAESQLMGVYPPGSGPKISPRLIPNGLPPLNLTIPQSTIDALLTGALPNQMQVVPIARMDFEECPLIDTVVKDKAKGTKLMGLLGQHYDVIKVLKKHIYDLSFDQLPLYYDSVKSNIVHKKAELPKAFNAKYMKKFEKMMGVYYDMVYYDGGYMTNLMASAVVDRLVTELKHETSKFLAMFVGSVQMQNLQKAFGIKDPLEFSSTIIIEEYLEKGKRSFEVKFNDKPLKVHGCKKNKCSEKQLFKFLESKMLPNYKDLCKSSSYQQETVWVWWYWLGIVLSIGVILSLSTFSFIMAWKHFRHQEPCQYVVLP